MNINIYDNNLNLKIPLQNNFLSCAWIENYNSEGSFTLEISASSEFSKTIQLDYYIKRTDRDTVMVIKSIQEKENSVVVMGKTATRQLYDVAFIGVIEQNSPIETSLQNAYQSTDKYPNIYISSNNVDALCQYDIGYKSMAEMCEILCQSNDVGFRSVKRDNGIHIELYKPEKNPNLKLSKNYGNLLNFSLSKSNENYKNYAIVLGQFEEQGLVRVNVDVRINTSEQKREIIVDAQNEKPQNGETLSQYQQRLRSKGLEVLLSQTKIFNVSVTPPNNQIGILFDLGDIVTIILNEYELIIEARIVSFQTNESAGAVQNKIIIGEPIVKRRQKT